MENTLNIYFDHIKSICPDMTEEELNKFSKGVYVTRLKKNECYISEGQVQKRGGFVVKGLFRAYQIDEYGNEKNIDFIPENDYTFDYLSFIEGIPCAYTFQCLEPSVIVSFSVEHLEKSFNQLPTFDKYARILAEKRLQQQQLRLESFLFKDAEQRYIDFINKNPQLFNRISISQLSSYLGVERQTITRIRKKLRQSS